MTSSAVHQLLFLISLFLLMNSTYYVQSLDVVETTTMSESAGTAASSASASVSTTTSSIARSLWDSWTTSNGNNVRTNPPVPAPAPVDAPKCQLCHDGSFPKNKYHGVGTYHRSNDRYNHPLCASDRQLNTHIIQTLTRFCFSPFLFPRLT